MPTLPPASPESCPACGHRQHDGRFCGNCGARLDDGTGTEPPGTSPARRPWTALGGLIGAAVVAAILWPSGTHAPPDAVPVPTAPPAASPTPDGTGLGFTDPTDTILAFDDRQTGVVAVHLDSGERAHVGLPGQRFGPRPYRLLLQGAYLIVGEGEIWKVALGGRPPPLQLGTATTVLPAAEPIELWFVDEPAATWTLVDAQGEPIASVDAPPDHVPLRGVPGGLAARDPDGRLVRYDLDQGAFVDEVGGPGAQIADVAVERMVWCEQECEQLVVAGPDREPIRILTSDAVERFHADAAWLSGGADRLAVAVSLRGGTQLQVELWVYDLERGERMDRTGLPLGPIEGAWTRDGEQFFAWVHVPQALSPLAPRELSRWREPGGFEKAHLDPGGTRLGQFVTFRERELAHLFVPGRDGRGNFRPWSSVLPTRRLRRPPP